MSYKNWNGVDIDNWQTTPCLRGRLGTEEDIKNEKAVFYLQNPEDIHAQPISIELPKCAIFTNDDNEKIPVIIVQAEEAEGQSYIGYRNIDHGNGICSINEVEILDQPNELFFK